MRASRFFPSATPGFMGAAALLLMALLLMAVGATGQVVHQKGRMFSPDAMSVARGEPVIFLNDDTVPHNIMSTTPDNSFDLGAQPPGSATPVSFDQAGVVVVICAIHPRMRMIITVTN
jgi:plastocyanin